MSKYNRRDFLRLGGASAVGLGIRSAITGLPVPFLLRGDASASTGQSRITILASSSNGEPLNVCGPGTFDSDYSQYFTHPNATDIDLSEVIPQTVNNISLDVDSLNQSSEVLLGNTCWLAACLPLLDLLQHLAWFNYRSGANIHPQYKYVLNVVEKCGEMRSEQLPSAIENTASLNTTTDTLFLEMGPSYSWLFTRQLLSNQAQDTCTKRWSSMGGTDNFAVMYDSFIDEAYLTSDKWNCNASILRSTCHESSRSG